MSEPGELRPRRRWNRRKSNEEVPDRLGRASSIEDTIDAFLDSRGLRTVRRDDRIFGAWRKVVGPTLAKRTHPVRYDGRLSRQELVVEVESAAQLAELEQFTGEEFRRRTNEQLGKELVARLTFRLKR